MIKVPHALSYNDTVYKLPTYCFEMCVTVYSSIYKFCREITEMSSAVKKKKLQTHMFVSNELQHLQSESNQLYLGHSYSSLGLLQFQYMPRHPNELVHFHDQNRQKSRQQHLKMTKNYNSTIGIKETSRLN